MKLIRILLKYSGKKVVLAIAASVLNGAANIGFIALIQRTLNADGPGRVRLIAPLATLCVVVLFARFTSEVLLSRLAQRAMFDLRMKLSGQILSSRLRRLEEIGKARLFASLTEDIASITSSFMLIPNYSMQLTVVVGCLIYLAWLSPVVFGGVVVYLALALLSARTLLKRGGQRMKQARQDQDALYKHFRSITEGTKELKLHSLRQKAFLNDVLARAADSYRRHNLAGGAFFSASNSWAVFLSFALLMLLVFGFPLAVPVDTPTLTGFTITLLYMIIHLGVLFSMPPTISRANIALRNIESLGLSLSSNAAEQARGEQPTAETFRRSLELVNVTHTYRGEADGAVFTLGPINLTFYPGELVFLTGGNGSGKTTLAKLITGLYIPEAGEIRLDGRSIDDSNLSFYRQHFSAVFSDFYLFESLLGLDSPEVDERARDYLVKLQLDRKVKVGDGKLSTTELSQGQRKRLALLTAYLEDRPMYVFDEWAADQDPVFKEFFYLRLLPEMRAASKTLLVISHDDKYYRLSDRVLKLDYGRVIYDSHNGPAAQMQAEVEVSQAPS